MIFLITGASGSGKSEYAEQLVCALAGQEKIERKIYLATMENGSEEAGHRIARHQRLREGKGFQTVESPFGILKEYGDAVVLLECISNLLANLMFEKRLTGEKASQEIVSQVESAGFRHLVIVTNEIFSDGTVYSDKIQEYEQTLGLINKQLAQRADVFCEVVYSIPVFLKGETLCPC